MLFRLLKVISQKRSLFKKAGYSIQKAKSKKIILILAQFKMNKAKMTLLFNQMIPNLQSNTMEGNFFILFLFFFYSFFILFYSLKSHFYIRYDEECNHYLMKDLGVGFGCFLLLDNSFVFPFHLSILSLIDDKFWYNA